jgi:GT2 family glycosyltransferase
MKVSEYCVCRGDGKSYLKFHVEDLQQGGSLDVAAHSERGRAVPINLFLSTSGTTIDATVVIPLVPNNIVLTFAEQGLSGETLGHIKRTVRPEVIKWKSRFNYFFRRGGTRDMRDIDSALNYGEHPAVYLDEAIPTEDDRVIVQGRIQTPDNSADLSKLIAFDDEFREIPIFPIYMGSSQSQQNPITGKSVHELGFSLVLPDFLENVTLYYLAYGDSRDRFVTFDESMKRYYLSLYSTHTMTASANAGYFSWYQEHRASDEELLRQTYCPQHDGPTFSIVVPLYKTPRKLLEEMLRSVMAQTYHNFELLLVNSKRDNTAIQDILDRYAARFDNIRIVSIPENLGITLNTKAGIDAAKGDYVAFLDHDDTLAPDALFEYAKAIREEPETVMLYCDEDQLSERGSYCAPFFKPVFSEYLLREMNFVCHFLCVKREELITFDIADPEYDGAQDHNVALQAAETGLPIKHVPRVLYHWRVTASSTAGGKMEEKPYANEAGKLAVSNHLRRLGVKAEVGDAERPCKYRVHYEINGNPLVSIIIPSKDNVSVLDTCMRSILDKSTYENLEIVVVENNSTERTTFEYYRSIQEADSRVRVVTWDDAFNFSAIINFGASFAHGEYLLLLNNDTEVITPSWIEEMLGICQDDEVGVVGAKLFYPDGTVQHAGVSVGGVAAYHVNHMLPFDGIGYLETAVTTHEVSAVTGACMMTPTSLFKELDGLDPDFAVAYNDIDYCLKARAAGKLVIFSASTHLFHYESVSRGYETTNEKQIRLHKEQARLHYRWPEYFVDGDPYLNPNLDPTSLYYRRKG